MKEKWICGDNQKLLLKNRSWITIFLEEDYAATTAAAHERNNSLQFNGKKGYLLSVIMHNSGPEKPWKPFNEMYCCSTFNDDASSLSSSVRSWLDVFQHICWYHSSTSPLQPPHLVTRQSISIPYLLLNWVLVVVAVLYSISVLRK